jgi:hypothetical protein
MVPLARQAVLALPERPLPELKIRARVKIRLPDTILMSKVALQLFLGQEAIPHDGLFKVAHCPAPRKMNGKDYEAATIMTHYESDYGAAVKVHNTKGQVVTVIVPNLHCTKWQGFRGKIVDTPSHPTCRSQMDIAVDGNWRGLLTDMQGFHTQVCYCDYLREVGYALKKLRQRLPSGRRGE